MTEGQALIAALSAGLLARPWARTALRWGALGLAIMFLLSLRRAGERAGRMAERLEALERLFVRAESAILHAADV